MTPFDSKCQNLQKRQFFIFDFRYIKVRHVRTIATDAQTQTHGHTHTQTRTQTRTSPQVRAKSCRVAYNNIFLPRNIFKRYIANVDPTPADRIS